MNYTAIIEHGMSDDTPVIGCGCDWRGTLAQVTQIGDCYLTPGDASPAGRCPECEGLVYVDRVEDRAKDAASKMLNLLERVGEVLDMSDPEHEDFADSAADCLQALCEMEGEIRAAIAAVQGEA